MVVASQQKEIVSVSVILKGASSTRLNEDTWSKDSAFAEPHSSCVFRVSTPIWWPPPRTIILIQIFTTTKSENQRNRLLLATRIC